ncbi:MAG: ABC transporter permease [Clostridia bacterium]
MKDSLGIKHRRHPTQPFILLGIILAMMGLQAVLLPGSVTVNQLLLVSRQASALGIIALGQAVVIMVGGIDLSVGSTVMITNVFCIALMKGSNQLCASALAVCVLIGLAIGIANAVGVLLLHIAPFVMTLCTMTILEGICYVYTQGAPTGSAAPWIRSLGTGNFYGVPNSTLIWLGLAVLLWVLFRFTTLGRKIYAVGGNSAAAKLSGISNKAVVAGAYVFCSLMAMLAGVILSGYLNITSLTVGGDYVMNSLAAVLIGGNAIEGGRGGVWGVVLGAFFVMLLMALMTMLGMSIVGKMLMQGLIIFAVVALQGLGKKNNG